MIQITNLNKYYGSHLAVDNINLSVNQGEILGLLGPNGAGKSTTIRMVTGYLQPTAGSIQIAGENIQEEPLIGKQSIGYLPESAPFYPEMLAYDYLRYVARIRAIPAREIESEIRRVADLCGLNDVMHQAFNELSRGYRQRVGLAHAIMGDPEILILDEPTSGLDPNQIVEIRALIKDIGREKTVIFSTHILSEAEAICDRIVIINRGKIVADSTPGELKQSLQAGVILHITLENARYPAVQKALLSLEGVSSVSREKHGDGDAMTVRVVCTESARRRVYQTIRAQEWMLLALNVEGHSMEDVFRALTGHQQVKGRIDGR
ncbi:MAG: ATP-binding cassette domain-containing protein [Chloroflexota bacterium]